jgi:hypothetical protein
MRLQPVPLRRLRLWLGDGVGLEGLRLRAVRLRRCVRL